MTSSFQVQWKVKPKADSHGDVNLMVLLANKYFILLEALDPGSFFFFFLFFLFFSLFGHATQLAGS